MVRSHRRSEFDKFDFGVPTKRGAADRMPANIREERLRGRAWLHRDLPFAGLRLSHTLENPMTTPTGRPSQSGDRNDNDVANMDRDLQKQRDKKQIEGEKDADAAADRDMGVR